MKKAEALLREVAEERDEIVHAAVSAFAAYDAMKPKKVSRKFATAFRKLRAVVEAER